MGEIGSLLGWDIIICYSLAIINYIVKFINRNFSRIINKNDTIKKYYYKLLKIIVKYHKVFGLSTILFILLHFIVQYFTKGIKITGIIALAVMILQIIIGIYGTKIKKKTKVWLYSHRAISIIIGIAVIIHIL